MRDGLRAIDKPKVMGVKTSGCWGEGSDRDDGDGEAPGWGVGGLIREDEWGMVGREA